MKGAQYSQHREINTDTSYQSALKSVFVRNCSGSELMIELKWNLLEGMRQYKKWWLGREG